MSLILKQNPTAIESGILRGDRRMLAKGITLVESRLNKDIEAAQHLLEKLMKKTGNSIRIAITGMPGAGKSTFIETLGIRLIDSGHKVAVLAIDPSSPQSGGSILGDKTRMSALAAHREAFIRPSPAGDNPGGVARKTRESMYLCEAAGFDIILIETVGVGQIEHEAASMVDFFMVLLTPGSGDVLQGMKKGLIELSDMLVINKADGENLHAARLTKSEYVQALYLLASRKTPVKLCSALTGDGVDGIWDEVSDFIQEQKIKGLFEMKRSNQLYNWMVRMTEEAILEKFRENDRIKMALEEFKSRLKQGTTTPVLASRELLKIFRF